MKKLSLKFIVSELNRKDMHEKDMCETEESKEENKCTCSTCDECTLGESFSFDKHMDSLLLSERKTLYDRNKMVLDSPIRERIKRHQEKPLNRIKIKG